MLVAFLQSATRFDCYVWYTRVVIGRLRHISHWTNIKHLDSVHPAAVEQKQAFFCPSNRCVTTVARTPILFRSPG